MRIVAEACQHWVLLTARFWKAIGYLRCYLLQYSGPFEAVHLQALHETHTVMRTRTLEVSKS